MLGSEAEPVPVKTIVNMLKADGDIDTDKLMENLGRLNKENKERLVTELKKQGHEQYRNL